MKMTFRFLMTAFVFLGTGGSAQTDEGHRSVPVKSSKPVRSHEDHSVKHGGQFFMAPDGFHHLEGAMPRAGEFRLYFYDDRTQPVPAAPFLSKTEIRADQMDEKGRELGQPADLRVTLGPDGQYLTASLPRGMTFPLYFTVHVQFPREESPDLFNFIFAETSNARKDSANPPRKGHP